MARKRSATLDESALVLIPEIAPEGVPFADVAYEHRCHREPHECCGATFLPGHVMTFRTLGAVPQAMRDDPALQVRQAKMGACRLQTTFRYVPMSGPEFNALMAEAEAAPEPEPIPEPVSDADELPGEDE